MQSCGERKDEEDDKDVDVDVDVDGDVDGDGDVKSEAHGKSIEMQTWPVGCLPVSACLGGRVSWSPVVRE